MQWGRQNEENSYYRKPGIRIIDAGPDRRLQPIAAAADQSPEADIDKVIRVLKIVPRAGLAVLIVIVLLIMVAARGL